MNHAPSRGRPEGAGPAARLMLALRAPVEALLTSSLRRVLRRRPEIAERLGDAAEAEFIVAPADFPVAFRLRPRRAGGPGDVRVAAHDDPAPAAARVRGPLLTLLALFDGSGDADAAFFSRRISVDGDTEAVVALHNTLEAAELSLAELMGLGPPLDGPVNGAFAAWIDRAHAGRGGRP